MVFSCTEFNDVSFSGNLTSISLRVSDTVYTSFVRDQARTLANAHCPRLSHRARSVFTLCFLDNLPLADSDSTRPREQPERISDGQQARVCCSAVVDDVEPIPLAQVTCPPPFIFGQDDLSTVGPPHHLNATGVCRDQ